MPSDKKSVDISQAVVAEWLRRLTRNQFPSGSAGSNPADCELFGKKFASSGNRTRAARVAGEHSTTEPTMLSTGGPDKTVTQSVGFEPTLPEGN